MRDDFRLDTFEDIKAKIVPLLLPSGATRIALYGSAARGEDTPQSDLDLLVSFRKPLGLIALARLQRQLSETLNRKVDLVTEGFLSRYIRPQVEKEKVILYEE